MKRNILLLLALLPGIALADPSIGTQSSRKLDTTDTSGTKRDKSLSADKSRGNRDTWSDSNEKAREKSRTKSHSTKKGNSLENSQANSIDINITSLLLKTFRNRYETDRNPETTTVQQMFAECRAVSGLQTEFPTLNEQPTVTSFSRMEMNIDTDNVVPYRLANHFHSGGGSANMFDSDAKHVRKNYTPNPGNKVISRYARCRIVASRWMAEAGNRAVAVEVGSEDEIAGRINAAFSEMDNDEQLFQELKDEAKEIWSNARCNDFLTQWQNIEEPSMNCGVFSVKGHEVYVENRKTLSEDAIEGRSYKIALNASSNDTLAVDDTLSDDRRVSQSHRDTDSRERFREAKKTASMSKSKNLDKNRTSSTSTGSSADITATPSK